MKKHHDFKVCMPHIEGVSVAVMQGYIEEAVKSWCGQSMPPKEGEPADEYWLILENNEKIRVTRLQKPRQKQEVDRYYEENRGPFGPDHDLKF